ncbi:MAG: multiheme c-type cytochrome, partial [Planctomycetota bacterium]
HDPGERISWTNRTPVSIAADTDEQHRYVWKPTQGGAEISEEKEAELRATITDTWETKRQRMKDVCSHCHTPDYIGGFYKQYDEFVQNYNEKFAKPGAKIMKVLGETRMRTFDDEIEWTWFYLWHHEGRRARHGASMMAPDYAHWHGMYEVAERFYVELIPQARELVKHAEENGHAEDAAKVRAVIDEIMARPEHAWSSTFKEKE